MNAPKRSRFRPRVVTTIAKKELREALRDRRTLFMMVFLPVLLYPALLVLATQVSSAQLTELEETPSLIGLYGAGPGHPAFEALGEHELLEVVPVSAQSLGVVDLIVDASKWPAELDPAVTAEVSLQFESIDDASWNAVDRVEEQILLYNDQTLTQRIADANLPAEFARPIRIIQNNRSTSGQQGGFVLGSILPMLVLVTVLMGAYYPAIDLTAGEKERSTIQTLFTAPISAIEIVGGKYIAVVGIAALSGGANLLSMGLVLGQNLLVAPELSEQLNLSIPLPVFAALAVTVAMLALFFSAVLLAVAVLARSFKEAQTFVTPVFLVCLVPAMIAQLPGFEYSTQLGALPAMGTILLMKLLLVEGLRLDALFWVGTTSLVWTALALVLAAKLFGKESVILGERGSLNLIPRRADILPKPRPAMGDAIAWYAVLFVLLFYVGATLQTKAAQPGLFATLWLVLLAPTLALAVYSKLDLRSTFHLRPAAPAHYAATVLLALSALVLVNWLNGLIDTHILTTPPELAEQMAKFFPPPENALDWVWLIFLVGVSPAVCEELVFRGFILAGVRDRLTDTQSAILVGLLFGIFHLSVYRLFGTTMLGIIMTFLVLRTRSIYPAMLFHFLNNTLAIVSTYAGGDPAATPDATASLPPAAIALSVPIFCLAVYALIRATPDHRRDS